MCAKELSFSIRILESSEGCKICGGIRHRHKETGMRSHYVTKHDLSNAFYFMEYA